MFKKVLLPLDSSTLAESALPHVKALAKSGCIGEIILFNAIDKELPLAFQEAPDVESMNNLDVPSLLSGQHTRLKQYFRRLKHNLREEGLNVGTVIVKGGKPSQTVIEYAELNDVDLIVIATHGYTGMKKVLLGSVALRILHESRVPVLLIRPEPCRKEK